MKKIRLSTILVLLHSMLCSIFILVSCSINAHSHNYSNEWSKDGSYHWQACLGCEEIRNKGEHDWNAGVITLQPTETSEGTKTFTCNTCGHTRVESISMIDAHEHTFAELWSSDDTHHWHSATCEHINEKKDFAEHSWNEGEITTPPTELEEGIKTYTCSVCFKIKTEIIPAIGTEHTHNYNQQVPTNDYLKNAATCTEKATYFYSCSCGLKGTETFEYGNLADHKFTTYISNGNATCTKDGTRTATCDVCKLATDEIVDVGSAKGHSYSDKYTSNDTYHWHVSICEHTSEISGKETHHWDAGVVTKQPTETSEGEKTYTCDVCQKTKVESIGSLGHIHTYASEYSFDDNYHWYAATCAHTSEVKDKESHRWDSGIVISEATVYDEGGKLYTCQDCGHIKEEVIAKIPSFTVVFYDFDSKIISQSNYKLNTSLSQILIPTIQIEEGLQFEKWTNIYDSKDITDIDFSKAQENAVYQFKPSFVKIHEVLFIDYEGNQLGETIVVRDGENLTANNLPTIPSRTGYTSKWSKQILSINITENKVFTPVYEVMTFNVTFLDSKNGNTIVTRTVEYGSFAIIPECDPYRFDTKLYGFTGWKYSTTDAFVENISGNKITNVYNDLTVYADYEESIEQPVLAVHIDGTIVTMSLCMPDDSSLYSINISMRCETEKGICEVENVAISGTTPLNKDYCEEENCTVYTEKVDWLIYNKKEKTIDFIWSCGNGHSFNTSKNVITIIFGVDDGAKINESIFSMLDGSNVVYGENGANISDLKKTNIIIWFY